MGYRVLILFNHPAKIPWKNVKKYIFQHTKSSIYHQHTVQPIDPIASHWSSKISLWLQWELQGTEDFLDA